MFEVGLRLVDQSHIQLLHKVLKENKKAYQMNKNDEVRCIDNILRENDGFIQSLSHAFDTDIILRRKYDCILLCGMGASGIVGELLSDAIQDECVIPIFTSRSALIPKWVDEKCLIVICSYSGNTIETINMYDSALECGFDIIVITSGGELEKKAIGDNQQLIKIEAGYQPRFSLGWFLGIMMKILVLQGKYSLNMDDLIFKLESFKRSLSVDDELMSSLIKDLSTRTPVICGTPNLSAVASRWKQQICENSKMVAFSGVLPECNHNEVVGWYNESSDKYCFIVIKEKVPNKVIAKTVNASIKTLSMKKSTIRVIEVDGNNALERMIKATMFGDYFSIRLADARGMDPYNIEPILNVKKYLID